jgi:DNA-binding transcriptional LysR family regulator
MLDAVHIHKYSCQQDFLAMESTMDLNRVGLFVGVVEAGSLTKAAEEIGITTSGVSRALARLEEDLGVRLLQRTTRKLSLTAAGRIYFDQVRGALAMVDEASLAASETGEEPRGRVRITVPPGMVNVMIPFVAEFLRRYPEIGIELLSSQQIVDLVERGIDLALRIGHLRDSSLIARRIGHMVTGLFASKEYVKRHGRPQKLSDLARHKCVLFRSQDGKDTWRLHEGDKEVRVEVAGSIEVDEIPSLHLAINAGMGIGQVSFFSSARMGNLVRILPQYIFSDLPISLVSPSKRLEPARVVLFRDFLAAKLSAVRWRG